MICKLSKKDLIRLIKSVPTPWGEHEYTIFCGDAHQEDWAWNVNKLKKLSETELWKLYKDITK